jgi:hypothetical protein
MAVNWLTTNVCFQKLLKYTFQAEGIYLVKLSTTIIVLHQIGQQMNTCKTDAYYVKQEETGAKSSNSQNIMKLSKICIEMKVYDRIKSVGYIANHILLYIWLYKKYQHKPKVEENMF